MTRIIYAEESSPLAAAYTSYSDSHLDCMVAVVLVVEVVVVDS